MIEAKAFIEEAFSSCKQYHYELYSSISAVNLYIWQQIVTDPNDLAMNPKLIKLLETALADQAKFWTVIFYYQELPVACACLSLFQADVVQSAPFLWQKTIEQFRNYKANLLKLRVLFCGLPVPCGHSHLRFSKKTHETPVIEQLARLMKKLAKQEKAPLIVFKEFTKKELSSYKILHEKGFIEGPVQPMHELAFSFDSFDHYYHALRSSYKHQIRLNRQKFDHQKFRIEHIDDPDAIFHCFTNEVHQLYLMVWQNSKERLEQLPLNFFRNLGYALPKKTMLTLIYQQEQPIAFSIGIRNEDHYFNLYCGVDYALKEELDLYFNLFYEELDCAFKQNVKSIFLGQTSDYFKSRLGSITTPRYFFVSTRHSWAQLALKLFKSLIFPKPPVIKSQRVFKKPPQG